LKKPTTTTTIGTSLYSRLVIRISLAICDFDCSTTQYRFWLSLNLHQRKWKRKWIY